MEFIYLFSEPGRDCGCGVPYGGVKTHVPGNAVQKVGAGHSFSTVIFCCHNFSYSLFTHYVLFRKQRQSVNLDVCLSLALKAEKEFSFRI